MHQNPVLVCKLLIVVIGIEQLLIEFRGRSFLFCYLSWNDIIHLIAYRFYYPSSPSFNPLMFFPKGWKTGERVGICSMVKFGGIRHEDMGST